MEKKIQANSRSKEITLQYFQFLDQHISDVVEGKLQSLWNLIRLLPNLPFPTNT